MYKTLKFINGVKGFTLIEIMIVIVILGVLAALVAPNILSRPDEARYTAAKTDIQNIANALDLYKLDNYVYPTTEQGLNALVEKPSGGDDLRNWNASGYLKRAPKDPWDHEYQYFSPGAHGPFDLYSFGADGKEGGEGVNMDVKNWEIN